MYLFDFTRSSWDHRVLATVWLQKSFFHLFLSSRIVFPNLSYLLLDYLVELIYWGFPGSSESKEFACNLGDLGLISGLEDLLKEGMVTHSSILA